VGGLAAGLASVPVAWWICTRVFQSLYVEPTPQRIHGADYSVLGAVLPGAAALLSAAIFCLLVADGLGWLGRRFAGEDPEKVRIAIVSIHLSVVILWIVRNAIR
jgi:hypothetical protein